MSASEGFNWGVLATVLVFIIGLIYTNIRSLAHIDRKELREMMDRVIDIIQNSAEMGRSVWCSQDGINNPTALKSLIGGLHTVEHYLMRMDEELKNKAYGTSSADPPTYTQSLMKLRQAISHDGQQNVGLPAGDDDPEVNVGQIRSLLISQHESDLIWQIEEMYSKSFRSLNWWQRIRGF